MKKDSELTICLKYKKIFEDFKSQIGMKFTCYFAFTMLTDFTLSTVAVNEALYKEIVEKLKKTNEKICEYFNLSAKE